MIGAVFAASMLQAITGIGFGVIAGPVLLVSLGSVTAIQISILLSLLIAVLLAPVTLPRVDFRLLRPLFVGVCLGTPLGGLAAALLSIDMLKLIAAGVVGCMTLIAADVLARFPIFERDSPVRRVFVGGISGTLNGALAMPGPAIAAYATAIRSEKDVIRATTLVTFLLVYPIALVAQSLMIGLGADLWILCAPLVLPTAAGVVAGIVLAGRIDERRFKMLTVGFLALSTLALLRG